MKKILPATLRRSIWRRAVLSLCFLLIISTSLFFRPIAPAHPNNLSDVSKSRAEMKTGQPPLLMPQAEGTAQFNEDPERRHRWFLFQRTYPFKSLPLDARRKAWDARHRGRDAITFAAEQSWRAVGPFPTSSAFLDNWGETSGRINAIAISPANPQLVLVGASTGGIWRSTDGGVNFAVVSDDQLDLAVGSIAFSRSNPSISYAGMGDSKLLYLGTGVLKSTDSGQTWARVNDSTLPQPASTNKIAVNPTDPNRVYVAQFAQRDGDGRLFASGFFLSTDGGTSWRQTLSGLSTDIALDPEDPQTLYLAMMRVDEGDLPAGLYRSVDGGNTWSLVFTSPYNPDETIDVKVGVTPADRRTVYVFIGGFIGNTFSIRVVASADGGNNWNNRGAGNLDPGQFGYNSYIYVDPANSNTVYVGTRDLYKSTNRGGSWNNLTLNFSSSNNFRFTPEESNTHPDQHALAFSPSSPNEIFIGNDGGISKTTDGGKSFRSLNMTFSLSQFYSLALHPTDPTISYGGTQDNGTQRQSGNFRLWREIASGDGGDCVINPLDASIVFTTFIFGNIFRFSNNGDMFDSRIGQNSTFGESETDPRIAFIAPLTGNGVDSKLYFGTWRLFVSTNSGDSWSAPAGMFDLTKGFTDVLNAIAVAHSNSNIIYTGSAQGRAMVSTDGGRNWADITQGLPDRFITDIALDRQNPAIAYLTVSGFGSGHVFKTTDTGATWADVSGNLPDIPTNALLIDALNPDTVYAGTDIGVFRSTTGGNTWESFNSGLPPVVVQAFAANSAGLIRLATYGRGVYELSAFGAGGPLPLIDSASFISKKLLVITGSGFGSAVSVFVNGAEKTQSVKSTSEDRIELKGKAKKLGFKSGDNFVRVIGASGASNVFVLKR